MCFLPFKKYIIFFILIFFDYNPKSLTNSYFFYLNYIITSNGGARKFFPRGQAKYNKAIN